MNKQKTKNCERCETLKEMHYEYNRKFIEHILAYERALRENDLGHHIKQFWFVSDSGDEITHECKQISTKPVDSDRITSLLWPMVSHRHFNFMAYN